VLDHFLGHFDVGDHAVAQRTDGFDVVGRLADHHLGIIAHGLDPLDAVDRLDRHDRGFVEHDAAVLHIDQRVCGAEIDCDILGTEFEESGKHRGHQEIRMKSAVWPAGAGCPSCGVRSGEVGALAGGPRKTQYFVKALRDKFALPVSKKRGLVANADDPMSRARSNHKAAA